MVSAKATKELYKMIVPRITSPQTWRRIKPGPLARYKTVEHYPKDLFFKKKYIDNCKLLIIYSFFFYGVSLHYYRELEFEACIARASQKLTQPNVSASKMVLFEHEMKILETSSHLGMQWKLINKSS